MLDIGMTNPQVIEFEASLSSSTGAGLVPFAMIMSSNRYALAEMMAQSRTFIYLLDNYLKPPELLSIARACLGIGRHSC